MFTGSIQNNAGTSFNPVNLTARSDTTPGHACTHSLAVSLLIVRAPLRSVSWPMDLQGYLRCHFIRRERSRTHGITLSDTLLINGMAQQASTNTVTLAPGFTQGVDNTGRPSRRTQAHLPWKIALRSPSEWVKTVSFDKLLGQQGVPDSGMTASLLGIGLLGDCPGGQAAPDEGNCQKQRFFSTPFSRQGDKKPPCRFVSGIKKDRRTPLVANMLISRIRGGSTSMFQLGRSSVDNLRLYGTIS